MQTTFTTALLLSATQAFFWDAKSDPPKRETFAQTVGQKFDEDGVTILVEAYSYVQCNIGDACWLDGCDKTAIIKQPEVDAQTYKQCIAKKTELMG
jgi:hypothetical protein